MPLRQRDSSGFRNDIEGLRALAIMLVVAAHVGITGLGGGFIGVDVFFVISGYLITRLLMTEWSSTGRIDFIAFYARRARRLLPALLVMLACTAAAASVLLAPWEQADQARAMTWAAFWVSNIRFAIVDLDYFGPDSSSNVVLHTWSLGVEEQFYLIWPFWLLAMLGAWQWQRRGANATHLLPGLLMTLPVMICLAAAMTVASPRLGFYMMPARFWQFVCGALVYAATDRWAGRMKPAALPSALAGLLLLVAAACEVDQHSTYPSMWAGLPTLAAMFLIAGGSISSTNALSRLLASAPFRTIGRVSYGWYLWHWPVLVLGSTLVAPGTATRAVLAALSFMLAVASYRLVEVPLRRNASGRSTDTRHLILAGLALCGMAGVAQLWSWATPGWIASPAQQSISDARSDLPAFGDVDCDDWYRSDRVVPCTFGSIRARHTLVLLGDSVAVQWLPAFRRIFDGRDWRLIVLTKSSCPAADIEFVYARIGRRYDECTRWRRAALHYVARTLKPDIVVIGSSSAYAFDRREWQDGTRSVLERLRTAAPHVYVLRATPVLGFDGLACLSRTRWRPRWLRSAVDCSEPLVPSSASDGVIDAVVREPRVGMIDLVPDVCMEGRCSAQRDGRPTYRDNQHLTATFAASLASRLGRFLHSAIIAVEGQDAANAR
jgi:peptidoglycan/LPS O-acetylase OafA/YrhL